MISMVVVVMIISNMVFVRDMVIYLEIMYFLIYINYFINIFVVNNYRSWNCILCLFILFINMDICFINCCFVDFNK